MFNFSGNVFLDIFISTILFSLAILSGGYGVKRIINISKSTESLRELNNSINSWDQVSATVVRSGYDTEYEFPYSSKDFSDIDGPLAREAAEIEFNKQKDECIRNINIHGKLLIEYIYERNDKMWVSRSVSPVSISNDCEIDILRKSTVGSAINIRVNPKDPSEAYITMSSESLILDNANTAIMSNIVYLAISAVLFFLSFLAISASLQSKI